MPCSKCMTENPTGTKSCDYCGNVFSTTQTRSSTIFNTVDLPQIASLKHRDFRYAWLAAMASGSAMWTTIVASAWMVFPESSSSVWVGIVTFGSMAPILFISPLGGLIGDTWDRRNITLSTYLISGAISGVLAILTLSKVVQPWQIALLAVLTGIIRAIQLPSLQALIPNLVPKRDLLNALVLLGTTRHGARFFGLGIAAPLLAIGQLGLTYVLILSMVLQIAAAVLMSRVSTASTGEISTHHGLIKNLLEGISYLYSNHLLALFIILVAFHCALAMSFESIMPVFSRNNLDASDPSIFGYLMMGFGGGSLIGMAAIAGVRSNKTKGRLLTLTAVMSGLSPILLATAGNFLTAVLFIGFMGASQSTFMALSNTYVQTLAPDALRARISSIYHMHAGGIMAFANLAYAFMADLFSAPPILAITGLLFTIIVGAFFLSQPPLKHLYSTGEFQS